MHLPCKIALFLQEGGRQHEPPWLLSADIIGVALHNYLQLNQMFSYTMRFAHVCLFCVLRYGHKNNGNLEQLNTHEVHGVLYTPLKLAYQM